MPLKVTNLSKRDADKWILRDVSFEVHKGEIFGLIGDGKIEKTTILRILAGTEKSTSGEIAPLERERQTHVFPALEKSFSLKNLFQTKSEVVTAEKVKIDFENVLKNAGSVILLDDPFCCFTENERSEYFANLRRAVNEKNLSVVFAANNSEDIFTVCDRIGVLHKGEIIQTGTPREIYEKPNSLASASALGRHNFIKAICVTFNNQSSQEFQTLIGDHRLQTDKSEKRLLGAINSAITLAIRPEHISISFGASFPEDNLLKAKISQVNYVGATTRVVLDAGGLQLEALVLRLVGLNIGDECMVGLPPDRILILKE